MEYRKFSGTDVNISRIGLGTWAIGGSEWGGSDEKESIKTILMAFEKGINFIDTAPIYGTGNSEEVVGKALKEYGKRDEIFLATKVGLEWESGKVLRNSSKERIQKEIDESLKRLQTDYIDLYQIHWPDPSVPIEETAETLENLKKEGKIRFPGVSNYSVEQMERFNEVTKLYSDQPPYNLFEREIEEEIIPYCKNNNVSLVTYSALCRGLLSGKMSKERDFKEGDIRNADPKYQEPRFDQYLKAVDQLEKFSKENYDKPILEFSVKWILDQDIDYALWGARKPSQLENLDDVFGWNIREEDKNKIDEILEETIKDPASPEFMAPGYRKSNSSEE